MLLGELLLCRCFSRSFCTLVLTISSFRSIFAFTGKSVFYTILLEGESYTWTYLETGFTLNPDPIQSNFSGLIDGFYKQLAAVDHQSYFIAPNAPRTAIQSLKTFLYDANETLQIQLSSQAAKSKFAWFALLPLLLVALILAAVYIWASYFRKRK